MASLLPRISHSGFFSVHEVSKRLVYSHVSTPQFQATAIFEALGNKTRLSVEMLFESAEQLDQVIKTFGAVEGLKQTLGRLEEKLTKVTAQTPGR